MIILATMVSVERDCGNSLNLIRKTKRGKSKYRQLLKQIFRKGEEWASDARASGFREDALTQEL